MLLNTSTSERPSISQFTSPREFMKAMLEHLKSTDSSFSITKACRSLRKVSPTLVSLVLSGKRTITLERVDEFSKLLRLTTSEKIFLRNWLSEKDPRRSPEPFRNPAKSRKDVSTHLLMDWLNVYVKDVFEMTDVQENRELAYRKLAGIASPHRIDKAIHFLLKEGHLRKTLDNKIVPEVPQTVVDPKLPHIKIRQFHKAALSIARAAIDSHAANERYANTMILSMDEEKYQELVQLIQEFAEKLKDFSVESQGPNLYQMIVNLSPAGGKHE